MRTVTYNGYTDVDPRESLDSSLKVDIIGLKLGGTHTVGKHSPLRLSPPLQSRVRSTPTHGQYFTRRYHHRRPKNGETAQIGLIRPWRLSAPCSKKDPCLRALSQTRWQLRLYEP